MAAGADIGGRQRIQEDMEVAPLSHAGGGFTDRQCEAGSDPGQKSAVRWTGTRRASRGTGTTLTSGDTPAPGRLVSAMRDERRSLWKLPTNDDSTGTSGSRRQIHRHGSGLFTFRKRRVDGGGARRVGRWGRSCRRPALSAVLAALLSRSPGLVQRGVLETEDTAALSAMQRRGGG